MPYHVDLSRSIKTRNKRVILYTSTFIVSCIALDIGCFAALKHSYGRLVDTKIHLGINYTEKLDFAGALNLRLLKIASMPRVPYASPAMGLF